MIRKTQSVLRLAIFILTCTLVFSGAVRADNTGTIITKDGRQFSDATYKIDNYFKVVKIKTGNDKEEISVSFTDIEAIIDENGYNVAPELLGQLYKPENQNASPSPEDNPTPIDTIPPPEPEGAVEGTPRPEAQSPKTTTAGEIRKPKTTWQSRESRPFKEATRKYWNVGFRIGGNFSLPSGDWYEGVNSGIGYEGDFSVALTHQAVLRFRVSKSGINVDDNYFFAFIPPDFIISQASKITAIRYILFLEYSHRLNSPPYGAYFYAGIGLGAIQHNLEANGVLTDGYDPYPLKETDTQTKFVTAVDAGFIKMLSPKIGIDGGITLDMIAVGSHDASTYWGDYYNYSVTYAYLFDLKFGVVFLF